MLRSLFSGVSGMRNNQTKMDVIGNNIANINTTAFKSGRVRFQDIFSQTIKDAQAPSQGRGGTNPRQVGLGMQVAGIDTITTQGSLQPTNNPLDCGIEGNGYFILSDSNRTLYTRDGAFDLDKDGNLINSDGFKIMGLKPLSATVGDLSGAIPAGTNWTTATEDTTITANSTITINGVTPAFSYPTGTKVGDIINDINENSDVKVSLSKGTGLVFEYPANMYSNTTVDMDVTGTGAFTGISIDESGDNTMTSTTLTNLQIPKEHGGTEIKNFSIEADGTIRGVYGDEIVIVGRIGLAKFVNPAGLSKLGGNLYTSSSNSGAPTYGSANGNGYGDIRQATLEMSNVDMASEFTEMIITSRAFQANSRTISTSDEMLQELLSLKR